MDNFQASGTKRRRLDAATAKLTRPFKTPFITNREPDASSGSDFQSSDPVEQITIRPASKVAPAIHAHHEVNHTKNGPDTDGREDQPTIIEQVKDPSKFMRTNEGEPHGDLRQIRQQIKSVRGEIDILERAIAAAQDSSNDAKLENLISKWRQASQDAAEVLFPTVKSRIEGQGGLAALQKRRVEILLADSAQDSNMPGDGQKCNADETTEKQPAVEIVDDAVESFDMPAMLKMLNIEHAAIGYDAVEERWRT